MTPEQTENLNRFLELQGELSFFNDCLTRDAATAKFGDAIDFSNMESIPGDGHVAFIAPVAPKHFVIWREKVAA